MIAVLKRSAITMCDQCQRRNAVFVPKRCVCSEMLCLFRNAVLSLYASRWMDRHSRCSINPHGAVVRVGGSSITQTPNVCIDSGPLRVVNLSRHKWPGGLVNCPLMCVTGCQIRRYLKHGNSSSHGARPVYSNHLDDGVDSDQ